jgi:hypothetical protein
MELLALLLRLAVALVLVVALLTLRVWQVVVPRRVKASVSSYQQPLFHRQNGPRSKNAQRQIRVMAVLGSGGHTTELLKLVKRLRREIYTPITFVVAETELDWKPNEKDSFAVIPRSREVAG